MPDYSSYRQAQQQPNPLGQISQLMGIQSAINQNQLFQQEFQDKAALNSAYQKAIDPKTGLIDYGLLGTLLGNSGAGRLLPQALSGQQEMQKRSQEMDKTQLEMSVKRNEQLAQFLAPLMNDPNLDTKMIAGVASQAINAGVTTPQQVAAFMSNMPQDQDGVRTAIRNLHAQSLGSAERAKMMMPNIVMQDVGGVVVPVDMNPYTNPNILNTQFRKSLTPGEAAKPVDVLRGNQPTIMSTENFMRGGGMGASAPALDQFGLTPEQRTKMVPGFEGDQQITKTLGQVLAEGGKMPTGPRLGSEAAANVAGTASANSSAELQQSAATAPQRIFQLEQAFTALNNPKVMTGPGQDSYNILKSALINFPGVGALVDEYSVEAFDKAKKYLTTYATSKAGALGQGTDAKLAAIVSGNPSMSISKLANKDLIKTAIGMERVDQAVGLAWDQSGLPPEKFNSWRTSFVKDLDPTVFVLDKLPQDKQLQIIKKMARNPDSPEAKKFFKSYNLAVSQDIIKPVSP